MPKEALLELAIIVVLGIAAQWVSWRLRWPAIVLLLLFGFAAGPLTNLLKPDALFGPLLQPLVSIFVAVILFEGGLSLRLKELEDRAVVGRLVSIGVIITWMLSTLLAHWLLGMGWVLAVLFGAILVVTGPTAILPLMRQVRLKGRTAPVLKWEGILIDPIGAMLAVLVFEAILVEPGAAAGAVGTGLIKAIAAGVICGAIGAGLLMLLLNRYWVPGFLRNPVTLALVLGAFAAAENYQPESGLLAVTLMGAILANQRWADVREIARFKEHLSILLISVLFIILAARIEMSQLTGLGWSAVAFLALLILIVRPAAVFLSTVGTELGVRERTFLAMIAPRGIVAAAVASAFALELAHRGAEEATQLVPLIFLVIVGTIGFSGLVARPMARTLDLAAGRHQGYLIFGAHPAAREIAAALHEAGATVALIDTNLGRIRKARMQHLSAYYGDILSESIFDELDLAETGRLLAMSANDEANSLAAVRFGEVFDEAELYQLPPEDHRQPGIPDTRGTAAPSGGRYLFDAHLSYNRLVGTIYRGGRVKTTRLTDQFDYEAFREHYRDRATPLFYVDETGDVLPFTVAQPPQPQPGHTLITLLEPEAELPTPPPSESARSTG